MGIKLTASGLNHKDLYHLKDCLHQICSQTAQAHPKIIKGVGNAWKRSTIMNF